MKRSLSVRLDKKGKDLTPSDKKTLIPIKMSNGQIENTKMPLESLITQRLRTALGGSVGVTAVYQLMWLTGLRSKRGKSKFVLSVLRGFQY